MGLLEAQHRKIIIILVVVILAGGGYWMLKHFHPALFLGEPDLVVETGATPPSPAPPALTPKSEVAVHVTGASRRVCIIFPPVHEFMKLLKRRAGELIKPISTV